MSIHSFRCGRERFSLPIACVVGVSNGGGEQLGRGGRELDLDYKVYKLKTNLSWGWARWPIPTLVTESCPLPTSALLCSEACIVVSWACCHICGCVEVGEGGGDVQRCVIWVTLSQPVPVPPIPTYPRELSNL